MQTFDASSLIYAWDNYPPDIFPPLWEWFAEKVASREFTTPQIAFDEVSRGTPECTTWLISAGVTRLQITNEVVQEALRIKALLGIINDDYHPRGVGENDILIIAAARTEGAELIPNEASQLTIPVDTRKYKIPAVCRMPGVDIPCRTFLKLIQTSGVVFR